MDKLPPSCAFGLPSYCAFRVSFPPPHFSSCNSLSDLQQDCHDSDHPKSHLIRGRIKWPQHQGGFPISILFGLRPLTFSSSIWLLYSGTPVNTAWPRWRPEFCSHQIYTRPREISKTFRKSKQVVYVPPILPMPWFVKGLFLGRISQLLLQFTSQCMDWDFIPVPDTFLNLIKPQFSLFRRVILCPVASPLRFKSDLLNLI